jgi:lysophospholipid acyltransferase (LPLAT)-like uncharacterized protein
MGQPAPNNADQGRRVEIATTTTTGRVALGLWGGVWNLTLSGGTGVVAQLERSFDGGVTWAVCTALGFPVVFGSGITEPVQETENGVLYALNVTAIASGTLTIRASQ